MHMSVHHVHAQCLWKLEKTTCSYWWLRVTIWVLDIELLSPPEDQPVLLASKLSFQVLPACFYANTRFSLSLYFYSLRFEYCDTTTVNVLLKISLTICSLLWLSYGFLDLFYYSVKYELGYLMKIILNLYINFGCMAIFTIILTVKNRFFLSSNIIFNSIDWLFIDSFLMSRKFSCSALLGVFLGIFILGICYEWNIFYFLFLKVHFGI